MKTRETMGPQALAARNHVHAPIDARCLRQRIALASVLVVAGMLYTWKLDQNGWANAYYSAAVQAGQHDPAAFFFGSSDWGNSITVDKPPLNLWIMGISVRLFGLNPWALMLPQVIMTLGSTYLIYALVRRSFPAYAALLASWIFATTPITVLLARYNNPDPLMVLLMLAALYAAIRATEDAGTGTGTRFLLLSALFLGLGFLAKQLQAFLVLPAIGAVFMLFAKLEWRKRLFAVVVSVGLLMTVSLAWPLAVDMTPAESRPFVGGSTHNSMLELTVGYNGLDRVLRHDEAPSVELIPQEMRSVDSDAGVFRLFNTNYGQEIGWLLAPGLLSGLVLLWLLAKRRFNRSRSMLAVAAVAWMATTYLMLSFMGNNFHSYYTASLAAPMALCLGIGAYLLVESTKSFMARSITVVALLVGYICSNAMWRLGSELPIEAGSAVMFCGLLTAALLAVRSPWPKLERTVATMAIAGLLVGPLICSLVTAGTPQSGSNPLSGSISRSPNTLSRFLDGVKRSEPAWAKGIALGNAPSPGLVQYLKASETKCVWAAATFPGQTAAQFQLAVGRPIMPLGGFAAVDPSPTLLQFKEWVQAGKLCFFVDQPEQLKVPGNSAELQAISAWTKQNFTSEVIDGFTVYHLVP